MPVEQKFTPGPWRVEEGTTLVWGACDPFDTSTFGMGYPVTEARVRLGHGSPICREHREAEAEANARLIAAAPDMVATGLQLIEAACAIHPTAPSSDSIDRLHEAIDAHSAAIAKATGGQ